MAHAPKFERNWYVQQRKWRETRTLYRQVLVLSEEREQETTSQRRHSRAYIRRLGARWRIVDDRARCAELWQYRTHISTDCFLPLPTFASRTLQNSQNIEKAFEFVCSAHKYIETWVTAKKQKKTENMYTWRNSTMPENTHRDTGTRAEGARWHTWEYLGVGVHRRWHPCPRL